MPLPSALSWRNRYVNKTNFLRLSLIIAIIYIIIAIRISPIHYRHRTLSHQRAKPFAIASADDEHVRKTEQNSDYRRRSMIVRREAMGPCPAIYGRVTILIAVVTESYKKMYKVAQDSLRCYLATTNYTLQLVDLDVDQRVKNECKHDQLFFKKHCAVAAYLRDTDWMLVLDADTGVVNPNHCIEEWIDDRVDILFYERFFNWEIAAGNYLVKNTKFAYNFLMKWADWQFTQPPNFNGADNGVLQLHIMQTVMPEARIEIKICDRIWHRSTGYETYMAYVTCVKLALGARRLWPGKLRIYRRAHGWVRDWLMTNDHWCEQDFMFHGWKHNSIGTEGWVSPFTKNLNVTECGIGAAGWHWREDRRDKAANIQRMLSDFELSAGKGFPSVARVVPYLTEGDIGECWPHCDDET